MDVSNGGRAEALGKKCGVEVVTVLRTELGELHAAQDGSDPPFHVVAVPMLGVWSPAALLTDLDPLVEELTHTGTQAILGRLRLAELRHILRQGSLGLTFGPSQRPGDLDRSSAGVTTDVDTEGPHPRATLVHGSPHGLSVVIE